MDAMQRLAKSICLSGSTPGPQFLIRRPIWAIPIIVFVLAVVMVYLVLAAQYSWPAPPL